MDLPKSQDSGLHKFEAPMRVQARFLVEILARLENFFEKNFCEGGGAGWGRQVILVHKHTPKMSESMVGFAPVILDL